MELNLSFGLAKNASQDEKNTSKAKVWYDTNGYELGSSNTSTVQLNQIRLHR